MDRLVAAFETMADELKAIRLILDRVLDDFAWALNNDKLKPDCCPNLSNLADRVIELGEEDAKDEDRGTESAPTVELRTTPADSAPPRRTDQRDLFS